MSTGTEVAKPDQAPSPPEAADIEAFRKRGSLEVAKRKEMNKVFQQLQGTQWGASLSPATKHLISEFCVVTKANPVTHVDLLGGKPYLNANYYEDLLNSHERFHSYRQRDLSPSVEEALRERAARHRELAADLEGPEKTQRLAKALDMEEEADDIALDRAKWSPRPNATVVIETTVVRFINAAPMEKIRSGEVTELDRYLVEVVECNWAGGMGDSMKEHKKYDPIGDANPGTTARTRSLRRAGTKAFSAWMQPYEEGLAKIEEYMEAEFEVVSTGPAGEDGQPTVEIGTKGEDPDGHEEVVETEAWDETDMRKRLFATLRDADVATNDAARKSWAEENDLPRSTKEWGKAEYERALELLVSPTRQRVRELAGDDLADLSLRVLGKETPDHLKEWQAIEQVLAATNGSSDDDGQFEL